MNLYVGTSGFSYKEWIGPFYPEDLPSDGMLAFYASKLNAVEINNTFYRLPRPSLLQAWADQVPEHFRFVLKASQKITHYKRLKNAGEETSYLIRVSQSLAGRLGPLFFQLPPNLRKDVPRLKEFLGGIPPHVQASFEFRHETWFDDEVFDVLRSHNAALCVVDSDDDLEVPFVRTADWGYFRLRREHYTSAALKKWMKAIKTEDWTTAFVFFKHEDEATGPKVAGTFLSFGSPA
jgi:uncharacterized protein YecE (DUF72 family)